MSTGFILLANTIQWRTTFYLQLENKATQQGSKANAAETGWNWKNPTEWEELEQEEEQHNKDRMQTAAETERTNRMGGAGGGGAGPFPWTARHIWVRWDEAGGKSKTVRGRGWYPQVRIELAKSDPSVSVRGLWTRCRLNRRTAAAGDTSYFWGETPTSTSANQINPLVCLKLRVWSKMMKLRCGANVGLWWRTASPSADEEVSDSAAKLYLSPFWRDFRQRVFDVGHDPSLSILWIVLDVLLSNDALVRVIWSLWSFQLRR